MYQSITEPLKVYGNAILGKVTLRAPSSSDLKILKQIMHGVTPQDAKSALSGPATGLKTAGGMTLIRNLKTLGPKLSKAAIPLLVALLATMASAGTSAEQKQQLNDAVSSENSIAVTQMLQDMTKAEEVKLAEPKVVSVISPNEAEIPVDPRVGPTDTAPVKA